MLSASCSSAVTNGGMARSNTTASPGSSTRQPMMPSVSPRWSRRSMPSYHFIDSSVSVPSACMSATIPSTVSWRRPRLRDRPLFLLEDTQQLKIRNLKIASQSA